MNKILLSVLLALGAGAAKAEPVPADWKVLAGDQSCVVEFKSVLIESEAQWQNLWKDHHCRSSEVPALPAADFSKERVVAVFLGERNRGGTSIDLELNPTKTDPPELFVTYSVSAPTPEGFALTALTQPWAFRRIANAYGTVHLPSKDEWKASAPKKETPATRGAGSLSARNLSGELRESRAWAGIDGLQDAVAMNAHYDGTGVKTGDAATIAAVFAGLPPPPGAEQDTTKQGKGLPPPPGKKQDGKKLPPPPGQDRGKPLPPPPGQDRGRDLPPPPGTRIPKPIYPGGPLPSRHPALENAPRTYSTWGKEYIGYWVGDIGWRKAVGNLDRNGKNPGTSYSVLLTSVKVQEYYKFYYDRQEDQIYWSPDEERIGSRSRNLRIEFTNTDTSPLYPWESERLAFGLTGTSLSVEDSNGAYRYSVTFTVDPRDPDSVTAYVTAGAKIKTAPDKNGVSAGIKASGAGLALVIRDNWAAEYAGETLEVAYVIRRDDGSFWSRDDIVQKADSRSPLRVNAQGVYELQIDGGYAAKRGTFYLESWSFRRAGSSISDGGWINKGKGNTIVK